MNPILPVLAFVCGFCIMAFELLGGKILAPYFGNSVYVWGSIITVFMLALSLGYYAGGRWSLNKPSLKRLAVMFVTASVLIQLMRLTSEPILAWVFSLGLDPRYGALLVSTGLFLPASIAMGMVSPYSVRLATTTSDKSGHTAGTLYFVATLGSAIGTITTSFYLVVMLPTGQILHVISLTLFACAIVSASASRLQEEKYTIVDY